MPDFLLPDLGEGLEEAEVTAWHVQVGDQVAVDQIVAEVETAKAAVEVPIPFAGTVTALHAEPGTTVPVGAPLISVAAAAPGAAGRNPSPRPHRMTAGPNRGPPTKPAATSWSATAPGPSRGAPVARAGPRSPPPGRPLGPTPSPRPAPPRPPVSP